MSTTSSGLSTIVFADGASQGNPGPGGWGAIIATPQGQVQELGGGERETTNNRMELKAVIAALGRLRDAPGPIGVYTDSVYVIRGITQWIWGWRKNGWKTSEGGDVVNTDLWKELSRLVAEHGKDRPISWHYVRGHSGIPGNERVDQIAVGFAQGRWVELYNGPLLKYDVPIHDIPEDTRPPEPKPIGAPKPQAYSYLSVVNGKLERHRTWPECEARVKGRSGAKFKKALSAADELKILAAWGYKPEDLS